MSTNDILRINAQAEQWVKDNAPAIKPTLGSGATVMFSSISSRNIRAMLPGTACALVLISLLMVFALRSAKIGLINLIPNLAPAAMGFGLWGIFVGEVGLALFTDFLFLPPLLMQVDGGGEHDSLSPSPDSEQLSQPA